MTEEELKKIEIDAIKHTSSRVRPRAVVFESRKAYKRGREKAAWKKEAGKY